MHPSKPVVYLKLKSGRKHKTTTCHIIRDSSSDCECNFSTSKSFKAPVTTKLSKKGNKKRTNSIIAGYIYEIQYKRIGGKTLKYKYHCRINSCNNNRLHKNWREKLLTWFQSLLFRLIVMKRQYKIEHSIFTCLCHVRYQLNWYYDLEKSPQLSTFHWNGRNAPKCWSIQFLDTISNLESSSSLLYWMHEHNINSEALSKVTRI